MSLMTFLYSYASRVRAVVDGLLCTWCPLYSNMKVENVDLTDRNVIVTGANSGIGFECARKFAVMGANVTLACRDPSRGESAKAELVAATGNKKIEIMSLDVASLASIRAFASAWGSKPIDILINNAGCPPARFIVTEDGLEMSYVANFLSQVLLTELLLPAFSSNSRIVMMSSIVNYHGVLDVGDLDRSHYIESELGLKNGDAMPPRSLVTLYADAKLCQVVYTRELQARINASETYGSRKIVVHACHPGVVNTPLWGKSRGAAAKYDGIVDKVVSFANNLGITPEQGSCTAVWLATQPKLSVNGGYYYDRQTRRTPHMAVEDLELRKALWAGWHAQCALPTSF